MIRCGISTSCYYPEQTAFAIEHLGKNGIRTIEIFVNTYYETSPDFVQKIVPVLKEYGITPVSVHPFTCGLETMLFFSEYAGRFEDGLKHYRMYFDFMNRIGAKIFVLHGCMNHGKIESRDYYERYAVLRAAAVKEGIILAQENVAPFKSHSTSFIRDMRTYLDEQVEFVLDIKQAVRAGEDPFDMLDAMGNRIVHTHVSDHRSEFDCLPIGEGNFDFKKYFEKLSHNGFNGAAVLELYRHNYQTYDQLIEGKRKLESCLL